MNMHWARMVLSDLAFVSTMAAFAIGPARGWWKLPDSLAKACSVLWICAIVGLFVGFRANIRQVVWFGTVCLGGSVLMLALAIEKAKREIDGDSS